MTEATYYFIGIKGSGMSALALVLHDLGHQVLGSDITQYTFTQKGLELPESRCFRLIRLI